MFRRLARLTTGANALRLIRTGAKALRLIANHRGAEPCAAAAGLFLLTGCRVNQRRVCVSLRGDCGLLRVGSTRKRFFHSRPKGKCKMQTKLVITRKVGESITVDGPATITIERQKGNRTVVAITAPPETRILRSEISDRRDEIGVEAA
jgi:carbon storage regulator CsrA